MDLQFIVILVMGFVLVAVVFAMFVGMFQKSPPNTALLVFGAFEPAPRIVIGGGTTVFPLIEAARSISLEILTFKVNNSAPIYSADAIPMRIEASVQIKVSNDPEMIKKAAEVMLSKDSQEVIGIADDVVRGNLCACLGQLTAVQIISGVKEITQTLEKASLPDMQKLGLEIVNFAILSISDDAGYLEQIGRKNTAEAKQRADVEIDKAFSL